MTEHPILFSAPMVRAILDGRKTMTRRIIKPQPRECRSTAAISGQSVTTWEWTGKPNIQRPGDRLWVRERFSGEWPYNNIPPRKWDRGGPIWYWADGNPDDGDWTKPKPSIHMPRWASRITLLVTDVRVERVQDISRGDCMAEGCPFPNMAAETDPAGWFQGLWTHLHGPDAWERNDWVSVTKFERVP